MSYISCFCFKFISIEIYLQLGNTMSITPLSVKMLKHLYRHLNNEDKKFICYHIPMSILLHNEAN